MFHSRTSDRVETCYAAGGTPLHCFFASDRRRSFVDVVRIFLTVCSFFASPPTGIHTIITRSADVYPRASAQCHSLYVASGSPSRLIRSPNKAVCHTPRYRSQWPLLLVSSRDAVSSLIFSQDFWTPFTVHSFQLCSCTAPTDRPLRMIDEPLSSIAPLSPPPSIGLSASQGKD